MEIVVAPHEKKRRIPATKAAKAVGVMALAVGAVYVGNEYTVRSSASIAVYQDYFGANGCLSGTDYSRANNGAISYSTNDAGQEQIIISADPEVTTTAPVILDVHRTMLINTVTLELSPESPASLPPQCR